MSSLQSESTAVNQRNLVLFVIEDFESQLKLSSSLQHKNEFEEYNKNNRATSHLYQQAPYSKLFTMNQNILNEIENETRRIATSVDSITENLSAILHSASALTVCCLETYKDAVCKTCDQINDNIKSVYQLIAKCEELSREMDVFYKIAEKIRDIQQIINVFSNFIKDIYNPYILRKLNNKLKKCCKRKSIIWDIKYTFKMH
ncbi:BLOC-1-related complex subunit 6 [Copidosoma floridanum]|uniref:BLOC-1-related complex subunit 6 n=1 Tax=Copidosoma floridanum TaxID=29053 RepID=UPI0006C969EC|nr:BLOC-1-related complex subunit 6 [Copidosoma floridanum]